MSNAIEIVTIGDELLLGLTIDTNGAYLARQLAALGIGVRCRTSVGDTASEIAEGVGLALERTGGVITTGGLGPTADDLTTPTIAALFGRALYFDEAQWERLRLLWKTRRNAEPPESNRQQVMLPEGCTVLTNQHGSAPGVWLEDAQGRWVAMLPGVPREMRGLWKDELLPLLSRRYKGGNPILTRTIRTTGIAESALPAKLGEIAGGVGGLSLAYLPGQQGVDLRLTARDLEPSAAEAALTAGATLLAQKVGDPVYGYEAMDLADVVLAKARGRGYTIAVAESCTGGLLGARLTSVPGSSDVFLGGLIAYSNEAKSSLAAVDAREIAAHGAVSEAVAVALARGAKEKLGASVGIGITGIAGPGGGSPEKPVGLVHLAVATPTQERAISGQMIGDREEVRFRATQAALDLARRLIQ